MPAQPQAADPKPAALGTPTLRVDGRLKVTGLAGYTAEAHLPGMAYAVPVQSAIRCGRITRMDTSRAESAPGVLGILTHRNAGTLHPVPKDAGVRPGQSMLVLQDDRIAYFGQYVAVVIAETLQHAQHAATLLGIDYAPESSTANFDEVRDSPERPDAILLINPTPVDSRRGDPDGAFAIAPHTLDLTYTTPIENHNPMEPHVTLAFWREDELTLIDSTQWVLGARNMVAAHLGLAPEHVHVVTPFVGGGFGAKGQPWPHPTLAALAARLVGRPVQLVLAREHMFSQTGHRPATSQRLRLAAKSDGRLTALMHDTVSSTSRFDSFVEASGESTRVAYSCPNLAVTHRIARLDTNTPCPMRGPGEASGSFTLEAAMDELAYKLHLDPLELRLRNYAELDEERHVPFSRKSLRACYHDAAERFGWSTRPLAPRSLQQGHTRVGWGMASAIFPAKLSPTSARITLHPDGRIQATSATHEIGTGTLTSVRQVVAEVFGVLPTDISLEIGDTRAPQAPSSAGSQTMASVGSAMLLAAREAKHKLATLAAADPQSPLFQQPPENIDTHGHHLYSQADPTRTEPWPDLLRRACPNGLIATAEYKPDEREHRPTSGWSFGAHFCEVHVDEALGTVRVARWVAAFAAGRIVNPLTATNQLIGGIVWGIGQALHEETVHDPHGIVNRNLAEYLVPTNRDVPPIDIHLIPEHDTQVNPLGVKGLGELGVCGAAAAVTNAIFHATGKRIRRLPAWRNDLSSPASTMEI